MEKPVLSLESAELIHKVTRRELDRAYLRRAPTLIKQSEQAATPVLSSSAGPFVHGPEARASNKQASLLWGNLAISSTHSATLGNIGSVHIALDHGPEAVDDYKKEMNLAINSVDNNQEIESLKHLARLHIQSHEFEKALDYYNQALAIEKSAGHLSGQAVLLSSIGFVYESMGENQKSLAARTQALQLIGNDQGSRLRAGILRDIGNLYTFAGRQQTAFDYLFEALRLQQELRDDQGESDTLRQIAYAYNTLGDQPHALSYYDQALSMEEQSGNLSEEAKTLNDLGGMALSTGDKGRALDFYSKALPMRRSAGDVSGEGITLCNIAFVTASMGNTEAALGLLLEALSLERKARYPRFEAAVLNCLGDIHRSTGNRLKAIESYTLALKLERRIEDRRGEAQTLFDIENVLESSSPDIAITFGKQAINVLQAVRKSNLGLEVALRSTFEHSIEYYYRSLASLLIEQQRFGEAEEVLDLLKNKEAHDFSRRDSVSDQLKLATLLDSEAMALKHYDEIADTVVLIGQRKSALDAKRDAQATLNAAEREEEGHLNDDLKAANMVLLRFLETEQKTFVINSLGAKRIDDFREAGGFQDILRQLGPHVVAIYTLIGPDKYTAMLITGGARKAYVSQIREESFNKKIFDLRQQLQNPSSDPIPLSVEMYHLVFPEGLRHDLDLLHAKTIMWSVDGALRYIPFAALHDGNEYLVKRFSQSLITPASIPYLTEQPLHKWTGVGFGVSEGEIPLPSVPLELHGIFRDTDESPAPVPGLVHLNEAFTRKLFERDLLETRHPVIHIATHFVSRSGVADNSYLMLGDGKLSLAEIQSEDSLFRGVDLLTLSGCNTAFTNRSEDGREVDSLGTITQRLGARSVIASLWSVNDSSTANLMVKMYQVHESSLGVGKGEALRQAQIGMLSGNLRPLGSASDVPEGEGKRINWSHPFYWAPFILLGNWK